MTRFPVVMKRMTAEGGEGEGTADEAIVFTVDHDILLCGIGVYGAVTPGRIQVHLQVETVPRLVHALKVAFSVKLQF